MSNRNPVAIAGNVVQIRPCGVAVIYSIADSEGDYSRALGLQIVRRGDSPLDVCQRRCIVFDGATIRIQVGVAGIVEGAPRIRPEVSVPIVFSAILSFARFRGGISIHCW